MSSAAHGRPAAAADVEKAIIRPKPERRERFLLRF
jgi:hypothetical protein